MYKGIVHGMLNKHITKFSCQTWITWPVNGPRLKHIVMTTTLWETAPRNSCHPLVKHYLVDSVTIVAPDIKSGALHESLGHIHPACVFGLQPRVDELAYVFPAHLTSPRLCWQCIQLLISVSLDTRVGVKSGVPQYYPNSIWLFHYQGEWATLPGLSTFSSAASACYMVCGSSLFCYTNSVTDINIDQSVFNKSFSLLWLLHDQYICLCLDQLLFGHPSLWDYTYQPSALWVQICGCIDLYPSALFSKKLCDCI